IDMGYQLLNNPMLLVDSSYKLLAYTKKDKVDDRVWNELVTKGYCSYDLISTFRKEGVVEKIAKSEEPLLTETGFSEKIRRIHGKIIINNKLVGYLGVLEHKQKFKEEDFQTIKLLCNVISEEMRKNRNYYLTKGLMYESLLIDLLDNAIQNWEHVKERLKAAGLKLESNLYLAVINFINEDIANYHLVDYLRDYIDHQLKYSKSIFYNDRIVVFLSLKDNQIDTSITNLEKCLKDNDLQAGISDRFDTIVGLRKAYLQAQKSLELGRWLLSSHNLYKYSDYSIYHILQLAGERHNLIDLFHPAPLVLKQYDDQNETDTYQTLYTYLCVDKNTKLAADKLFIHRNTMSYRLKQIAEIASINLDNFEECVQIYLSYKMLDLINFTPDASKAKVKNPLK
ncbi:MAG: PucR family transcriptional regulator, partial [Tepidanaerobacteraceae bacterium]